MLLFGLLYKYRPIPNVPGAIAIPEIEHELLIQLYYEENKRLRIKFYGKKNAEYANNGGYHVEDCLIGMLSKKVGVLNQSPRSNSSFFISQSVCSSIGQAIQVSHPLAAFNGAHQTQAETSENEGEIASENESEMEGPYTHDAVRQFSDGASPAHSPSKLKYQVPHFPSTTDAHDNSPSQSKYSVHRPLSGMVASTSDSDNTTRYPINRFTHIELNCSHIAVMANRIKGLDIRKSFNAIIDTLIDFHKKYSKHCTIASDKSQAMFGEGEEIDTTPDLISTLSDLIALKRVYTKGLVEADLYEIERRCGCF